MASCAVIMCKNHLRRTKTTDVKYFRFPRDEDFAKKWIVACRRKDKINLKNARICSVHFEQSCFEVPLKERLLGYTYPSSRHLKHDAVPTLNLFGKTKKCDGGRSQRLIKRSRRQEVEELIQMSIQQEKEENSAERLLEIKNNSSSGNSNLNINVERSVENNQTEVLERENELLREKNTLLQEENQILLEKNKKYEAALSKIFTKGQIKKLMNKGNIHWSPEDIAAAISLHSVSPKGYRYLKANNYPLPAMSTLRQWVSNFDVQKSMDY